MRIRARRLSNGSLFKLIFVGASISLLPFFTLCGIASIFGANTVRVNDSPVTGPVGLVAALILYPVFALGFSCVAWLIGAFGLWIYSKFRRLEIELVDGEVMDDRAEGQAGL
jgi:uncharacterized membrane protein YdbT with pleckstrin-like domain